MSGALDGIRVLDLTSGVSGPWCATLLAKYGADVIKVEHPGTGDSSRGHGRFPDGVPHREKGALFLWLNAGKRSVTLDVATSTGRALALQTAAQCDAAIVDQPPSRLAALRLTPDDLRAANERLVVTCVNAFGQSGPHADWAATNIAAFAAGGQHYLSGDPDREPLLTGGYQAEYQAGTWAFGATLAALWDAAEHGRAQTAEVAGVEVMASILELYLPDFAYRKTDVLTKRRGNIASAGIGIYPASDGHIGIHCMPKNWLQLLDAMDARWMADDERFVDGRTRLQNDDALSAELFAWTTSITKREAYERAGTSRAPISPVNTVEDLLASPHLQERGFFTEVEHPVAGPMRYPGAPSRMSATPARTGAAPLLGQHNAEVYGELCGLAARDLARLRAAGVI